MPTQVLRIDVFISSPSDVAQEREILKRVIERLNRGALRDDFFVVPFMYEDDVPPQVGQEAQLIVDRFLRVQQSQIMVCMFWSRMGTPFTIAETGNRFESGTQYEFIKGYEHFLHHGCPYILLYRRMQENPEADAEQRCRVDAFFGEFQGPQSRWKGLWAAYDAPDAFEEKVRNDLERMIRRLSIVQDAARRVDRPEFEEEARRLDAAIPQAAVLGETTEVRAMICLPDSEGLAALLPAEADDAGALSARDVREGNLAIAFPRDVRTGELRPASLAVEIEAPDFEVREPRQTILLSPWQDSGTVSVLLKPVRARERARVLVRVKGRALDGGEYLCGSAVLHTQVTGTAFQRVAGALWKLVSVRIGGESGEPEAREEIHSAHSAAQRARSAAQRVRQTLARRPPVEGRFGKGRASRAARWVLHYEGGPDGMLRQIGLLGAEIAIPNGNDRWWLVRNVHTSPECALADLPEDCISWMQEDPAVMNAIASRLGLALPPQFVLTLFPSELEERLLLLEREYNGADESEILSTAFHISGLEQSMGIEVIQQALR